MKRVLFLMCGCCWFLFALGFGFFLLHYITDGAGLQALNPLPAIFGRSITAGSVMTGLMQGAGLFMASVFCLFVGLSLCVHGLKRNRSDR